MGASGALGTHRGCRGLFWQHLGAVRGVGGVSSILGANRDLRYSGARRGIGASGTLGAPKGCRGAVLGC